MIKVMMRFASATLNEALAQVWHGVTLTARSPMLKSYCSAEITAFKHTALVLQYVCRCSIDMYQCVRVCLFSNVCCGQNGQMVIEVMYHKPLPEIIWLQEVATQKAVTSCSGYAADAANNDHRSPANAMLTCMLWSRWWIARLGLS